MTPVVMIVVFAFQNYPALRSNPGSESVYADQLLRQPGL
jgi:hypothetical protein